MAVEMFVFSDTRLNSIAEWQTAIDAEGFPLKLEDTSFLPHIGFLPAQLNGKATGFEFYHDPADELMLEAWKVGFDHDWQFALGFQWRGYALDEWDAAWMAATAYAIATNGVVYDDAWAAFTAVEAREQLHKSVRDRPKLEAAMRELDATRPQRVREFKARWSEKP